MADGKNTSDAPPHVYPSYYGSSDTPHYGNDVPFDVPEGWAWVYGKDLFRPMTTTAPKGEEFLYIDIDAIDNEKNISLPKKLKTKLAPSRASRYTQVGDTLFSMVRPYLRNIAQVEQEHCIASTGFFVCNPCGNICKRYIYYMMLSDYVVSGLNQFMKGDNSPSINSSNIENWSFPIPPVTEQEHIVDRINKMFALIDAVEQEKLDLKTTALTAKSKILDLALSGKLSSHTSHYGKWCMVSLKDVVQIKNGYAFKSDSYADEGIRVIRISNVQDGYISDDAPKYYPLYLMEGLDDFVLHQGDLLMSLTGNVGRVGFLPEILMPAALNQRVACIRRLSDQIDMQYLFYIFKSHLFLEQCIESGKGVAQQNISTEWLKSFKIQLPPIEEQREIVETLSKLFSLLDSISAGQS